MFHFRIFFSTITLTRSPFISPPANHYPYASRPTNKNLLPESHHGASDVLVRPSHAVIPAGKLRMIGTCGKLHQIAEGAHVRQCPGTKTKSQRESIDGKVNFTISFVVCGRADDAFFLESPHPHSHEEVYKIWGGIRGGMQCRTFEPQGAESKLLHSCT